MAMTFQSADKTLRWFRVPADRCEKGVAIGTRKNHALVLVKKSARTLQGKITGGETGNRHCLLNHLLCRWRQA
jgi:hypothetical protein